MTPIFPAGASVRHYTTHDRQSFYEGVVTGSSNDTGQPEYLVRLTSHVVRGEARSPDYRNAVYRQDQLEPAPWPPSLPGSPPPAGPFAP